MTEEETAEIDRIVIVAAMLYQIAVSDVKELIIDYILNGRVSKEMFL